jgi:sugar O-acyltransferase (sialic acid O-acetyltransferase NeuD family)
MVRPIVFWGATGHAKVLREFIARIGYELVALFDNDPEVSSPFPDVPLYYRREGFERWRRAQAQTELACLVAIGGARGRARLEVQRYLEQQGLHPATAVHPAAYVAVDAALGRGCQVLAGAVVATEARLGEACIVNTRASVDHECELGAGVHLAPGAVLTGVVRVGEGALIGPNAVVLPRLTIGRDAIVGAGSVVTRDVPDGVVVYGNPARVQRKNETRERTSVGH